MVDDNPFVRTPEGIRPRAATFHRFVEAVAEVGPFTAVDYCIPVASLRPTEQPPLLAPVDEARLHVVPTVPFLGAVGYLLRAPLMWWRNRGIFDRTIGGADLVWLKVPASNALLAIGACRRHRVDRFAYVVGSTLAAVDAQDRPSGSGLPARVAARVYDAVARSIARSGPSVILDAELFTSVVDEEDAAATTIEMPPHRSGSPWRIAWAGRMVGEKGVADLMRAVAGLIAAGRSVELLLIGDGPRRAELAQLAELLGLRDRIAWAGYVGEPTAYLDLLRSADLFVLPSRAEGVPKVLIEAMAAGVPVIATRSGDCAAILGEGTRGLLVEPGDVEALQEGILLAIDDPRGRAARRSGALEWARRRTRHAMARRLVAWMATHFPEVFAGTTVASTGLAEERILPQMPSSPGGA